MKKPAFVMAQGRQEGGRRIEWNIWGSVRNRGREGGHGVHGIIRMARNEEGGMEGGRRIEEP
jgi:hypothetical protein